MYTYIIVIINKEEWDPKFKMDSKQIWYNKLILVKIYREII